MTSTPYAAPLPPDPVGDANTQRKDLITQILELQGRYSFAGTQHTRESLATRSMKWLEKLCDMQLLCITLFHPQDRNAGSNASRREYERAIERMNDQNRRLRGARPAGYIYDECTWRGAVPEGRGTSLGPDGSNNDVRQMRRRMA